FAFLDIMPTTEGHTQVIPKYHAETLADLPDEYLRDIGPAVRKVALVTGVDAFIVDQDECSMAGSLHLLLISFKNNGKLAFQHVPHVHFHVIPKPNETEGLVLTVGQNWPQKKVDNEVLAATCEKMKGRLGCR
ncbi:hypothetical protein MPER_03432, partial [Moniliophthora perniciosa FA553]